MTPEQRAKKIVGVLKECNHPGDCDCWDRAERAIVEAIEESAILERLHRTVDFVKKYHPLPKCIHGHNLKDHAGTTLKPDCGCAL